MKTVQKMLVKDKSTYHFLSQNLVGFRNESLMCQDEENVYYWMKDEIFLKKECGLLPDDLLQIELSDVSQKSRKELKNTYVYKVAVYDDVALKLTLTSFSVDLLPIPRP